MDQGSGDPASPVQKEQAGNSEAPLQFPHFSSTPRRGCRAQRAHPPTKAAGAGRGVCPTPSDTFLPEGVPFHGHMEDLRVTPPSQPRSGDRQGHTQLEKRGGPSPAAPAGRRPAEAPLQEEALRWGCTRQPTGWQEGRGTPRPGMETATAQRPVCFGSTSLNGFPGGSVVTHLQCTGGIPGWGRSPGVGNGNPLQYLEGFPGGSAVKNLLQCRRPGFDP